MRVLQAFERLFCRLSFRTVRRNGDNLRPCLRGAGEILLAERFDDTEVQQRLGMFWIHAE
jgi:hypothetical protein